MREWRTTWGKTPARKKRSAYSIGSSSTGWEEYIGTMPSITEEQQAVSTPMSEYLAEAMAGIGDQPSFEEWSTENIPDVFGGQLGEEAQGVYSEAMAGEMPSMFGGELGAEAKSAYTEALAGQPVDYDPSGANFLQNIIPAIKESYVGTGAITGTEVGDRINREASVRMENIANIKAGLYNQAKARQAMAAGNYQQAYQHMQQSVKSRKLLAAGQYTQAYQQNLSLAYDNYIKQYPAATEILQAALAYLNIPMMAAYQKPEEEKTGKWGSSSTAPVMM